MISRRSLVLGGAAALATGLSGCSSGRPAPPRPPSGSAVSRVTTAVSGSFDSRYRLARTGWTILYPPGPRHGVPVVVALHGRGGDHTSTYRHLALDRYLTEAVAAGTPPFAIASVDGGDAEYWHPRLHTDPSAMVVREFLPLLARHGLDVRRIGLFGWSMGGYGALYIASVLRAGRVAAVAAESPAIWAHSAQVADGSFDGPSDFHQHALWQRLRLLRGIDLRVDCGAADGFAPIARVLRSRLSPRPAGGIQPGGHDDAYWKSQAPAQLRWLGPRLTR